MAVERTASAHWEGSLATGSGTVPTGSGVLKDATVTWSSRAEQADENTSPEELIAQVGEAFRMTTMRIAIRGQGWTASTTTASARPPEARSRTARCLRRSRANVDVSVEAALA